MKKQLKHFVLAGIALLVGIGLKAQYTGSIDISPIQVSQEKSGTYDVVRIEGCSMTIEPGSPYLPIKELHIALPANKTVSSIQVLNFTQQELKGSYEILPTQYPRIPELQDPGFKEPNIGIYGDNSLYPAIQLSFTGAGFASGVHIAGINYCPLQYNPITKKLVLTTHIEYRVNYTTESNSPIKPRRLTADQVKATREALKAIVDNPNEIDNYFQLEKVDDLNETVFTVDEFPNFEGQPVQYVIITNELMKEGFQEIADWKTKTGRPAVVRTVEWIDSYYNGADQAEKVRSFITDAYQNWGAVYFMLGGDVGLVPCRIAWMSHFNNSQLITAIPNGDFIPADMYYACLDGNWNADGDATFGESNWNRLNDGSFYQEQNSLINLDTVDRLPEVYVGRVPVETMSELNYYKTKLFEYLKTSSGNEKNTLLFSADSDYISSSQMDQVGNEFPASFSLTKLYEKNGAVNTDVFNAFNGSDGIQKHIICGYGHGGPTTFEACLGVLNRNDMDNLSNTNRAQILYNNHCKTLKWNADNVVEHFINSEKGGVAGIGYATFGWTSAPSIYNKTFINRLFTVNNQIGNAFTTIKTISYNYGAYDGSRRMDFFSLSLASDPDLPVWTNTPQNFIVSKPASVTTEEQTIPITISNLANGVEAIICLFKEDEVYALRTVTGNGSPITTNISCIPDTEGDVNVAITAHNYIPYEATINVNRSSNAHLYAKSILINDDNAGISNGNNNGKLDAGETIELFLTMENSGLSASNSTTATLGCSPDHISLIAVNASYPAISASQTATNSTPFIFEISEDAPDNALIKFDVQVYDGNGNEYNDMFWLEMHAAELEIVMNTISTQVNNDDIIDPGDNVSLNFELYNPNSGNANGLTGIISSNSPYIEQMISSTQNFEDIPSFGYGVNQVPFEFKVVDTYNGETINLNLNIQDTYGKEWDFAFDLNKPDAITGLGYTSTNNSISLFWDPDITVKGYNVYRSDSENGEYLRVNQSIVQGFSGYTDNNLDEVTIYYYKVAKVGNSGVEGILSEPLMTWTSLPKHPNWLPFEINTDNWGDFWNSSPNAYDTDGDGLKEVFVCSGHHIGQDKGAIWGFEHDGEELYNIDNNPTTVNSFADLGITIFATPAIGDIDNDGVAEVVVATRQGADNDPTKFKLLVYKDQDANNDNNPDLMWEKQIHYKNFNGVVLADMNNNDKLEIIVPNQKGNKMEVFDYQGNDFPGWPVTTSENPIDNNAVSLPVAVDLNNDGTKEIAIGMEGGIYAWNADGTEFFGTNPIFDDGGRLDCPVIATDIDNDGDNEILFMSIHDNKRGYIYALENDGSLNNNWDSDNHYLDLQILSPTWAWPAEFICADIDLDGSTEVLFADKNILKVWDNQGNLILNKNVPGLQCQFVHPMVADIDDNNEDQEIIIASNEDKGYIYAFKLDGSPVKGWPLKTNYAMHSLPLIDDIDNDGKNEIVAVAYDKIYGWDSYGDASLCEWGKYRLNSFNNAFYKSPCRYNSTPEVINQSVTLTDSRNLDHDLIIEAGTTKIMGNYSFCPDAKIIVKPGAKLILDGGVLSKSCSALWQGIEVHGNSYAHQDETYQGKVELKNGAVIENAVTGIRAGALKTSLKNGGIVWASDATFKNCVNGIVFQPYRNYNPSNPQETSKNKSFISQCNFQTTGHLANLGKQPQLFVMLDDVDMIYIKGNTFANSNPGDYAITGRGKGVYANNASFTASYICSSQVQPCPEEDRLPNHFEGLTYGIMAENDAGYGNVQINENTFTNNLYGIRLHNLTNPVATLNNITVLPTYEGAMNAMGIFLQTCNQYQVEENFINCQDAGTSTIGVNVVSTGFDPNEIYKNTFENLGYGLYAARTNIGLQLLCNEFINNHQQIYVEEEGSIASHQGNPEEADAGNIFTPDCSEGSSFREIYNLGPDFFYYHLNEELKEPLCVNNEVALRLIEMDNNCPSNLGGGGSGQVTEITEIDQKATEEQQAKADLQSIIDGGNTQQLNTTVQSSPPSAALQLRNQLLGESPYLSETVMSTTATSEQSLPPVMVRDVLVANPLAGRSENVDSALDSRQNPLPWYLLAQIKAAGQNMSARDLMEAHISKLGKEKEEMIKNNIKSYLTDTNGVKADSVIYLYSNYPTLDKAYSLVHFHLQNGNTTQARNVYQGISSQFQLSSTQQDEYNRTGTLLTMAETIYANDSTWHSIDSSQLSVISNIALDISDRAGLWARSILALHEQAEYDFPVIIADSSKSSNTNPKPVVHSYSFNVYPDPANDYFAVEYCIEDRKYKEARLEITAIDGKNMESMSLEHPADQLLFKTKSYKPGIYLCKLRLDNSTEGMKRFTITKGEEGAAILSTIEGGTGKTPVMMVYPNPSGGNFTVEYTTGSKQCNNCKLQIVNLEGKIMKEIAIDKPAGRKQVDAGDMENGIYYMIFYNNDNPVFREKIIIQ